MDLESYGSIVEGFLQQIVGSLVLLTGFVFWRSNAIADSFGVIGILAHLSRIDELDSRMKTLLQIHTIRLSLFVVVLFCIWSCLFTLFGVMRYSQFFGPDHPLDIGLAQMLTQRVKDAAFYSRQLCVVAAVGIFIEWAMECTCRFKMLGESELLSAVSGRVESSESLYFQRRKYNDVLALWQSRIRFFHNTRNQKQIAKRIGDVDLCWHEFTEVICEFRSAAARGLNGRLDVDTE